MKTTKAQRAAKSFAKILRDAGLIALGQVVIGENVAIVWTVTQSHHVATLREIADVITGVGEDGDECIFLTNRLVPDHYTWRPLHFAVTNSLLGDYRLAQINPNWRPA